MAQADLTAAAGMVLREDGLFHAADEAGATLFTLSNLEADSFAAEVEASYDFEGGTISYQGSPGAIQATTAPSRTTNLRPPEGPNGCAASTRSNPALSSRRAISAAAW